MVLEYHGTQIPVILKSGGRDNIPFPFFVLM